MDNINILDKNKCCGCMACMNSCPVNAIEMKENEEGFLEPVVNETCIHCGKCVRACPVLTPHYENEKQPEVYAVRAEDEIRAQSSSGGMFSLFAREILNKGGYVCGAAFDEDIELKHILINQEEEMPKLRGSKYLQSHISLVYREIQKLLKKEIPVLFSGTPCQVAGLKNFLGKEYPNLYTLDILCHGVASQKLFSQYLEEKFEKKEIRRVGFRDKELGWGCTKIHVNLKDGTDYIGTDKDDTYEMGFHSNLFIRKSCINCIFAQFPRQGDITCGDFWGISKLDPSQHDKKGTSLVFVNTPKGREIFEKIQSDSNVKIKEYDFSITKKIKNRIKPNVSPNPKREDLFQMLKENSLENAVNHIKNSPVAMKNIAEAENITQYFRSLQNLDEKYLVIISSKWSVGRYIDSNLGELLKQAGFQKEIVKKIALNYIGVVYGKKTLFEAKDHHQDITYRSVVNGSEIYAFSHREEKAGKSSIKINQKEYSVNRRGLNIVIYDTESRKVLDSVSFDTATPEMKAYRKK